MHAAERAPQREIHCVDSLPAEDMCGSCDFYRHRISSALPDRLDRLPNPRTGTPCAADMHLLVCHHLTGTRESELQDD